MKQKQLKNLKSGDLIYIFDINYPEKGISGYKVIDIKHIEEQEDYCSCGPDIIPEHWYLHFDSPYLDRSISISCDDTTYKLYSGSYAKNNNGKCEVVYINLILFSDLSNTKEIIEDYYNDSIEILKLKINNCDKEINKMILYKNDYQSQVANIVDKLNTFKLTIFQNL